MKKSTLELISGVLLIFLGVCHQTAHVLFSLDPNPPKILADMQAFEIELMGMHTLAQFHTGFSLMTGLAIIFLGIFILCIRTKLNDKTVDLIISLMILSVVIMSAIYFHVLAYGVSALAGIIYILSNFKSAKK